jgi:hypothetical protein
MKIFFTPVLILILLLSLTGCIQVDTLIKVKLDGSGVIEETVLMNKAFVQQIRAMVEGMAEQMEQQTEHRADQQMSEGEKQGETKQDKKPGEKPEPFDMFNEKELKKRASEFGEGVSYLSGSRVVTDDYEGYKAFYAFKDIQKIRINQNPGEKVPSASQQESPDAKTKKEYITFIFTKGKPAELLIKLPADKTKNQSEDIPKEKPPAPADDQQAEAKMAQMKQIFEGMKISVAVEVEGTILDTNATHREGSRITLMELDFGKFMEMAEYFEKFSLAQPDTLEETKQFMKDIPGVKVELHEEIKITFK